MKIFLIIFDTLRKDHSGKTYGNEWIKTPNFDVFAQDCVIFDEAYPESLPTIPFRRAVHTGIRTFPFNKDPKDFRTDDTVHLLGPMLGWYPIPHDQKHISEYMNQFGYTTGFISSTYHQFKPGMNFHLGFDQWNWIRGHEDDKYKCGLKSDQKKFKNNIKHCITSIKGKRYERFAQQGVLKKYFKNIQYRTNEQDFFVAKTFLKSMKFLKENKNVKDLFLLIDEFDPHEPWDPPISYRNLYFKDYTGNNIIQPAYTDDLGYITEDELRCLRANYAGEVTLCDKWFGKFIEFLKNEDMYDDSLIILISDHGHSIGEHNLMGKIPFGLYPELVDIPFMIKPPGNIENGPKRILKSHVYNHDILPTIFSMIKGKSIPEIFNGIDLSSLIFDKDSQIEGREYTTIGFQIVTLYKDENYALMIMNNQNFQKLFNLKKDPDWNENIADDNPDIVKELFAKIEKDAEGQLVKKIKTKVGNLKDWYVGSANIAESKK